jgi:hypothetical protein
MANVHVQLNEIEKKKQKADVFFFPIERFFFTMHEYRHTASVVLVHNDQALALVVLVDKSHRDHTDLQGHHAYCTDHRNSLVVVVVVVAFFDVHKVNHTDEILHSYSYYAYSDMIDRDRRRLLNNRHFDSTTSLDNLDF